MLEIYWRQEPSSVPKSGAKNCKVVGVRTVQHRFVNSSLDPSLWFVLFYTFLPYLEGPQNKIYWRHKALGYSDIKRQKENEAREMDKERLQVYIANLKNNTNAEKFTSQSRRDKCSPASYFSKFLFEYMVVHLYKICMDIWDWTSQHLNCNLKLKFDFYKIAHIDSAAFLPIIISSFFAMHVENIKWIQNCYLDIWEWTSQRLHCKDWIQEHFLKLWKLWTGFRNCILCLKLQICSIIWILKCSKFSM